MRAAAILGISCFLLAAVYGQGVPDAANTARGNAIRQVAITIDDLPYTGRKNSLQDVRRTAERFVEALATYGAPASGFVTSTNVLVPGEIDERLDALRQWRDGRVNLENHGFAHLSFNTAPLHLYLDEVGTGRMLAETLMRERNDSVRFFRAPFNQTGPTLETKQALLDYLGERGLRLAPFTVEHADYLFNALYEDALERGDTAYAARVGVAYVAQLDSAFQFAERLSKKTFGREISQVFLIHANRINADFLDEMLGRLHDRGYSFISFEEALEDKAYATPDEYVGKWGISWLHRWRAGLGLENHLRFEPEPPDWVLKAYDELSGKE